MPACRVCGLEVAEDQESCPSCGAVQDPVVEMSVAPNKEDEPAPIAAPDPSDDELSKIDTDEISDQNPAATTTVASTETDGKRPGLKPLGEQQVLNGRYTILRKI